MIVQRMRRWRAVEAPSTQARAVDTECAIGLSASCAVAERERRRAPLAVPGSTAGAPMGLAATGRDDSLAEASVSRQ